LIALGILAIGMSMVAAIFPAAMVLNRSSANSTLGTIICENGMVLAEMALTSDVVGSSQLLDVYADDKKLTHLSRIQQRYPTETEEPTRTGFVLMVRKVPEAAGVFQLITVAYRKKEATHTVELVETGCTVSGIKISKANNLRIGSPLINRQTGEFAFIDSINQDGTSGTLDIKPDEPRKMTGGKCYVLVEKQGVKTIDRRSPAIGVMSKMTGLTRDPGNFGDK
jgi:hypothetical protein